LDLILYRRLFKTLTNLSLLNSYNLVNTFAQVAPPVNTLLEHDLLSGFSTTTFVLASFITTYDLAAVMAGINSQIYNAIATPETQA
jgi:hypothetical protein